MVVLLVGAVLVVLNQTLLSPALPSIMEHLSVNETTVQWLTSAYAMVEAIVIPLSAWFMGRFRTRPLFMGGMVLFCCGCIVSAVAPAFPILLLGRVLQALATGVLMVMVMSLILLVFPREKRGQAMGLVGLVIGFAPAVGPSIGGVLVDTIGWRASFGVVAVLAVVVIICAARFLSDYDAFPRTHFDPLSVVLSSLGLASLLYGISSFASSGNAVLCAGLIVIGALLIVLFARRQTQLEEPMLQVAVLKSRKYRTGVITVMLLEAVLIGGGGTLMPLYIQNVLGYPATVSGLIVLPGALLGALAALLAGRVFDRFGVRGIGLIASVGACLAGLGMCFYATDSSLIFVIGVNILFGVCIQLMFTPINTWGVNSLDNKLVQHATAVTNTMNQTGAALGTALIMSFTAVGSSMAAEGSTPLEATFAGYHMAFEVVFALFVVVFVVVLAFVRDRKGEQVAQSASDSAPTARTVGKAAAPTAAGTPDAAGVLTAQEVEEAAAAAVASGEADITGLPQLVADVMDTNPLTIPADASASQAVHALAEVDASGAPVVQPDGTVVGFLSNSDIIKFFGDEMAIMLGSPSGFMALRALDDEDLRHRVARLTNVNVTDIATKRVESVSPDTSFASACKMLAEKRYKELPVIEDGKLLGVIRRRNLMRIISHILDENEEVL